MDPSTIDQTAQSLETGITTIDQANEQAPISQIDLPMVSAKDALGLDETPSDSLKRESEKALRNVPEDKVAPKRNPDGKFKAAKPKAETPTVTKPAAAPPTTTPAPIKETPQKVKIGEKEYSISELEKALNERQAASNRQPEPQRQAPAPEPQKQPSPEEIAAMEMQFVQDFSKSVGDIPVNEDQLEKILIGGKEGVAALVDLLKHTSARATLEARKSIYAELNPHVQTIVGQLTPLVENNAQLERYTVENMFTTQHPEYQGELLGTAKMVAEELVRQYPQITSQYTREQFIAEVDRQSSRIIGEEFKRWNPNFQGTWKDYAKMQKANQSMPAAVPPTPETAAKPAVVAAPMAKPSTQPAQKQAVKPPASNSPHNMTGGSIREWGKSVAGSLVD